MLSTSAQREEIVALLTQACQSLVPSEQFAVLGAFAQRFFAASAVADLQERSLASLVHVLLSQWQSIYNRVPGSPAVKVFNPSSSADGWESNHTIITVTHDDMPFIVDSIRMELDRLKYQVHFIIHIGGLHLVRDSKSNIVGVCAEGEHPAAGSMAEAPLYFEIDRITDPHMLVELHANITKILGEVSAVVADWPLMVTRVQESLANVRSVGGANYTQAAVQETAEFLQWLIDNNFTFLGYRFYDAGSDASANLPVAPASGLGLLRNAHSNEYRDLPLPPNKSRAKELLVMAKTNTASPVHRADYTDYIGVPHFAADGKVVGQSCFIGLYTSLAYNSPTKTIPLLRQKVAQVLADCPFPHDSHDGKELVQVLETLPRDDLFQASPEELWDLAFNIVQLQERKRLRLFMRHDSYACYISCLVYLPREDFTTDLLLKMQSILEQEVQGLTSRASTYFSDSVLARIHYNIRVKPGTQYLGNIAALEERLVVVARSWSSLLKEALLYSYDQPEGLRWYAQYLHAFPASYIERYAASQAVQDIDTINALISKQQQFGLAVTYVSEAASNVIRLKIFNLNDAIILSDVFPILEHMGLRVLGERSYAIQSTVVVWLNEFDITYPGLSANHFAEIAEQFKDAFAQIWLRKVENDYLNSLVCLAQLTSAEINILRAYTKYLRQIGFNFSQAYIEQTLLKNAHISAQLVAFFNTRFNPDYDEERRAHGESLHQEIVASLEAVTSLDEDTILRQILGLILATVRTNFFQQVVDEHGNTSAKEYLSFKFKPQLINDLPLPRPQFEIFVFSIRVEGVHLRGGKAARGGIRWSDRREDFRTEVLGLMKAQQVKNALIVPVGAKGGFYPKLLPVGSDKDAIYQEAVACYRIFIKGLLDLTDNIVADAIVPPPRVVRHDDDDHYLVVAADKGTATFSDIANAVAQEYNFWLGDAFASGGSAGYDHKKIGITARGAWVAAQRNLRCCGLNPDTDNVTVVGIGDMAGDVFGNGLLLSKHLKLLAAFNHQHIFLDPKPEPESSFSERQRLFNLPKSTWADYNPQLISPGGGVYSRNAKSIPISPQVREVLGITAEQLQPSALIKAILAAPVDLLWNGGIGTFVKSINESHAEVRDKANDAIRLNGQELRARTVAEGGNLGFTQLGRIEYAMHGGLINTDFIDNSAGVNCSDHEVNIKILLNKIVAAGQLTIAERNALLAQMTDEVAALVLYDNQRSTQILDLETARAPQHNLALWRFMLSLEQAGRLDRGLEFLPSDQELTERQARGKFFTRPEIAVLLSYCKLFLKQDILASSLPEDPYFTPYLLSEFPKILAQQYSEAIHQHRLKREIIATQLSKAIVDRVGIGFINSIQQETGASIAHIVQAYTIVIAVFSLEDYWVKIEELADKMPLNVQQDLMMRLGSLAQRTTRWFVRNVRNLNDIAANIAEFKPQVRQLQQALGQLLPQQEQEALLAAQQELIQQGVSTVVAGDVLALTTLCAALDVVTAARSSGLCLELVAKTYFILGSKLQLSWLRGVMNAIVTGSQWLELGKVALLEELDVLHRQLTLQVLTEQGSQVAADDLVLIVDAWMAGHASALTRWQNLATKLQSSISVEYAACAVLLKELAGLLLDNVHC